MHRLLAFAPLCALLSTAACVDYLEPGDFGTPRYLGDMRGEVPMKMIPPLTDRSGNVYVPYAATDLYDTAIHIGTAGGGWVRACRGHRGDDHGFHGWIGRGEDRVWYWSGDSLIMAAPRAKGCRILGSDPVSRARLSFKALFPSVRETPSHTTTIGLVQADGDPAPYFIRIDLLRNLYSEQKPFSPAAATDITVLGVGVSTDQRTSYLLVRYRWEHEIRVELLSLDQHAVIRHRVPVVGLDNAPAYSVRGYLLAAGDGPVTGLLASGELVVVDRQGGRTVPVNSGPMRVIGVHRWEDRLYAVGASDDGPMIAAIASDGALIDPHPWSASTAAVRALDGRNVRILDDRSEPMKKLVWSSPKSAIGTYPFLTPFPPEKYATDTTSWLIAGPSFLAGGERMTSVAFLPLGIQYR